MSEHKHTLGPWRCEYGEVRAEDKDGIVWAIAKVGKVIGEDEANARLIAAAPDMLAVLEDILPEIECRCGEAYTGRGLHESNSLCHHVKAVKAAIAKAKGNQLAKPIYEDEQKVKCGLCSCDLTLVRPGKYQCDHCEL